MPSQNTPHLTQVMFKDYKGMISVFPKNIYIFVLKKLYPTGEKGTYHPCLKETQNMQVFNAHLINSFSYFFVLIIQDRVPEAHQRFLPDYVQDRSPEASRRRAERRR